MVSRGVSWASPSLLQFRDPNQFIANNLHNHLAAWESIVDSQASTPNLDICKVIREGVKVQEFFAPFRGSFQGVTYDSDTPPRKVLPNARSCSDFTDFITRTILDRVQNGSLIVWGKADKVAPPHLVMPLTIEPNKPRMCHDERFLNHWIKDCPFKLDCITDLPRYFGIDHFQTTFDDKSGYDHVGLHPSSRTFFGLEWNGWYFVYTTLPFGWKASAFIYNSVGLAASSFIRTLGVPCTQYIDDRHVGQLRLNSSHLFSNLQLSEMASFIACSVLVFLGYFIGLKKSSLKPMREVRFLGYICDFRKQAFILPQDKRLKFANLRESILSQKSVSLKNLQKFSGKTTSFSLLVPAAKLFSNYAYQAISRAQRSSSSQIRITDALRSELLHWRFLDSWSGFLPWKDEKHTNVTVHSDASNTGWGGVVDLPGKPRKVVRGLWDEDSRQFPIVVKEAKALLFTLESALVDVFNARIDVFIDNKTFLHSWERQTSKSPLITDTMKQLFKMCMARNLSLSMQFVPSHANIADGPSRTVSDLDASLSPNAWRKVKLLRSIWRCS